MERLKRRREYDPKLIGKNLRRLREKHHLSVEQVRGYLDLGSVQAIYKYETGRNYPQADLLLALLELYQADYMDLICEDLISCDALRDGDWMLFAAVDGSAVWMLDMMIVGGDFRDSRLAF